MPPIDIRKPLRKLMPTLLEAKEQELSEAQTVQRLIVFFRDVLGYDELNEISREVEIQGKYVDIALKIDGKRKLLVEAKAASVRLKDSHIDQAKHYAAEDNIEWVLLTNGVGWTLFHLTFREGINYDVAFDIDLVEDEIGSVTQHLSLIHRKSVAAGQLNDFWAHRSALSPSSLSKALFHEDTLRVIRRTLRNNSGIRITEDDVAKAIYGLLSLEARETIGKMKVVRKKKPKVATQEVAVGGPLPTDPVTTA